MKKILLLLIPFVFSCNPGPWVYSKYRVTYNCSHAGCQSDYVEGEISQLKNGCIEYYHVNDNWDRGSRVYRKVCGTYQIEELR